MSQDSLGCGALVESPPRLCGLKVSCSQKVVCESCLSRAAFLHEVTQGSRLISYCGSTLSSCTLPLKGGIEARESCDCY